MASWLIRVVDGRSSTLPRDRARELLEPAFGGVHITIDAGPSVVFSTAGPRPGEWAFQISEDITGCTLALLRALVREVLAAYRFRLLTLHKTAPIRKRRLYPVPPTEQTPPHGIPKPRMNSPYDMISEPPLPYAGDTR
jgi:hypothetical protein